MSDRVAALVPNKPDVELASEFKSELAVHLTKASEVIERARKSGIQLSFNVGADSFGKIVLKEISAVKPL